MFTSRVAHPGVDTQFLPPGDTIGHRCLLERKKFLQKTRLSCCDFWKETLLLRFSNVCFWYIEHHKPVPSSSKTKFK